MAKPPKYPRPRSHAHPKPQPPAQNQLQSKWRISCRALSTIFGLFLLHIGIPCPGSASESHAFGEPQTPDKAHFYFGPTQPIGHTLDSPESKQRIDLLLAAKLQENVSDTPIQVDEDLPPLVDGEYGFQAPQRFDGIPKAILNIGSYETKYAIVVEKLHHRLTVFESTEDVIRPIQTFRAITGKDPNDKLIRGDLRTPEGVYFVNGMLQDNQLPPKYGRLALTLDYPNVFDRMLQKSGYGIWIHATDDPKRLEKPFDTEGCVAVSNEDILKLAEYITPEATPIVITKEMTTATEEGLQTPRESALKMLESWRTAWQESEIESYISYYSESFRHKHMDREAWQSFKSRLANQRSRIEIRISEPTVVAFEDQLVMSFLQEYRSNGHADFGTKSLYMRWEDHRYRIISEVWKPLQKTETAMKELLPPEGAL